MATGGNNRINFQVGFNVDKSGLNEVSQAFQKMYNVKSADFSGTTRQLQQIKRQAMEVETALTKAFNPNLNSFNLSSFKQQLSSMGLDLNTVYNNFSRLGVVGQNAFNTMSTSLLTTNLNLKQTNNFVKNIGTTLMNTVKWTVASSAIRAFTGSISQAFTYVKSLDSSLNDIRIVTKDSADQMANFAVQANRAASQLGRSTLDYTKAALTFYQQGLDDQAVQARTQAVLKAQNITGAGSQMADYLTAVWNGYKVANEQAETYVDKLAAVADSSASNMSQIAIAMSKVSSAANILGVDVDSLAAQIATIVATTRQAPQSVGNALKTVYARINDISTGADDAEVSLGNYSKAMLKVGVSVLDSNGRLRNTGDVIDEVGEKWSSLSREQQIFLARTMAGQRQYNKLITLFDNWSKYTDLVTISMQSQGATEQKNAIYMESLAAKTQKLGVAQQRLKSSMVNSDSYGNMIEAATKGVTLFANFIQSIGGGTNALVMFASTFTALMSDKIAASLNNVLINMDNAKYNAQILASTTQFINDKANVPPQFDTARNELEKIKDIYGQISNEQRQQLNNLLITQTQKQNIVNETQKELEVVKETREKLAEPMGVNLATEAGIDQFENKLGDASTALKELQTPLSMVKDDWLKLGQEDVLDSLVKGTNDLAESLGTDNELVQTFNKAIQEAYDALHSGNEVEANKAIQRAAEAAEKLKNALNQAGGENLGRLNNQLKEYQQELKIAEGGTQRFLAVLQSQFMMKGLVNGLAGLGQFASGINSVIHITKIWENQNLSTGEKILQTITSVTMAFGMLTRGISKMIDGFSQLPKLIIALGSRIIESNTAQTASTVAATKATAAKTAANIAQAASAKGAEVANYGLAKSFAAIVGAAAPYILLIGGLAALVIAFANAEDESARAIEEAGEAARLAADKYKELKDTASQLDNSIDKYHTIQGELENLKTGTEEWNDKLRENNDLVIDLVDKFPQLVGQIENVNGVLEISEAAFKALQEEMQKTLSIASFVKTDTATAYDQSVIDAKINRKLEDFRISSYGSATTKDSYQTTGEKATYKDIVEVAKIFSQYKDDLNAGRITEERLISIIEQNSNASSELAQYLLLDQQYLGNLAQAIKENEKKIQLNYTKTAQQNYELFDDLNYKASDDIDKAIIAKIGGIDLKKVQDELVDQWISKLDEPGAGKEAFDQQWADDVLKVVRNTLGSDINWASNDSIQGSGNQRQFAFRKRGESSDFTLDIQYVAEIMAAEEALKELGNSSEKTSKALQDLDNNTLPEDAKAIRNLLLGKDFYNLTEAEIKALTDDNNSKINEYIKKHWEQFGYENEQAMFNALDKAISNVNFDKVFKGFSQDVQRYAQAYANLDNATYQTQQKVGAELQKAFDKGGSKQLGILDGFYSKIINFDAFQAIIDGVDFATISAEELESQMVEAGAATELSTNMIQAYIDSQKESAAVNEVIAKQNYNSIHKITDKIKDGTTLEEDDVNILKAAGVDIQQYIKELEKSGVNVKDYFEMHVNGSVTIKKKAEEFVNYANNISLKGFKDELNSLTEKQELTDKLSDSNVGNVATPSGPPQLNFGTGGNDIGKSNIGAILSLDGGSERAIENQNKLFELQLEIVKLAEKQNLLSNDQAGKAGIIAQNYQKNKNFSQQQANYIALLVQHLQSSVQMTDEEVERMNFLKDTISEAAEETKKLDPDVKEQQWKNLTEYLQDYADKLDDVSDDVQDNEEVAQQLAQELLRFDSALESVSKNYQTWQKQLKSDAMQDQIQASNELKNVYSDLLDLPFENLTPDFTKSTDNLKDLKEALDGDVDAYNRLMEAARQDIAAQIIQINPQFNDAQFQQDFNNLYNSIESFNEDFDDLQVGASLNDQQFLTELTNMINAAGMTADQATDYLASMGVNAKIKTVDAPLLSYQEFAQQNGHWEDNPTDYQVPGADGQTEPLTIRINHPVWVPAPEKDYEQYKANFKGFSLQVESANKKSGGGFKYQNSTHGSGTGKKGGGSKGSKKSPKSSSKKPNRAKRIQKSKLYENTKKQQTIYNPYQRITKQYERQSQLIDKIQKQEDKLSGKDRLKNLTAQNTALQKQNDILKNRQAISDDADRKGTTANLKKQLEDTFKFFKDKKGKSLFGFDADGQIKNVVSATNYAVRDYNKKVAAIEKEANIRWNAAQNDYNKIIAAWNKKSASEQEELNKKAKKLSKGVYDNWLEYQKHLLDETKESIKKEADNRKDAAKKQYDNRLNLLKEYQERLKEDKQFYEQYAENIRQIIENQLSKIQIKVQLKVDQGQFERQYLDFRDKFVKRIGEKDFRNKAKSATRNLFSYLDSGQLAQTINAMNQSRSNYKLLKNKRTKFINNDASLTDDDFKALGITREAWADTKRADRKRIIDEQISKSYEQLKEFTGSVEEKLIQMQEYADEIKETLLSAYDQVKNNQDDILEQYDRINSVIQHGVKLSQMVFGDKAYAKAEAFEQAQLDNDKAEMKRLETYKQYWQKIYNTTEDQKLKETALNNLRDFSDKLQSQIEKVIEQSDKLLQTKINKTIDDALEKFATLGTEGNRSEWDHLKEFDDAFLDVAETRMGIRQIERLYDEVGDSLEGDVDQQKKFNEFQKKQINLLKSKNNLTQYDLDRAKAALEVEKAKYALQQAREKKVELRLRRDSQGNYTYQFVAQEEALEDKTADLEEKIANLYKLDKDQWINGVDAMQDRTVNFIQTITQLQQEYNKAMLAGEVERAEKIKARIEMQQKENDRMWKAMSENLDVIQKVYLVDSYGDAMGQTFSSTEEALNSMKENVDIFDAQAREYINAINGQGGLLEVYKTTTDTIQGFINEYNTNILDALKADEIVAAADGSIELVQGITELASAEQDMINGYEKVLTKTQEQIKSITKLLQQADDFMDTLRQTGGVLSDVLASYKVVQGQNAFDQTKFKDAITSGDFTTTDLSRLQGHINDLIDIFKDAIDTTQMASGGYTGDWGSTGKLAFLHEKELVLNAEDTSNLLAAVQSVRAMTLGMTADNYLQSLTNGQTAMLNGLSGTQLDQNVHIEANFPNVRDHLEIERAFDNLINIASMHAAKKQ